ncbi:MAG: MmcQ/YjbR family DNA-binding protein [Solirubrobacterales bacterium]|nr:MmcQ/YjbR family DNA-binding protein [Solirubrobacterales bacterium]
MASWEDVSRIALELPQAVEQTKREQRRWLVKDRLFVWERPLRPKEIEALRSDIHEGPILAARVEHLGAEQALLAEDPHVFFTTPHFERTAAILLRLDRISPEDLDEVIVEAWLARAPKRLVQGYLGQNA